VAGVLIQFNKFKPNPPVFSDPRVSVQTGSKMLLEETGKEAHMNLREKHELSLELPRETEVLQVQSREGLRQSISYRDRRQWENDIDFLMEYSNLISRMKLKELIAHLLFLIILFLVQKQEIDTHLRNKGQYFILMTFPPVCNCIFLLRVQLHCPSNAQFNYHKLQFIT